MRTSLRLLALISLVVLFASVTSGCGRGPAKILSMEMCTEVNTDGNCSSEATNTFGSEDDIFVSVKFENFSDASSLVTRWYYGYDLIKETSYKATGAEDGYHAFQIPSTIPHEKGSYRADVSPDADPQPTIQFEVE